MDKTRSSFLRASGRKTDILPLAAIISFVMVLLGQTAGILLMWRLHINEWLISLTGSENSGTFLGNYASFIGIWIVFFLYVCLFRRNRPMLKAVGYSRRGNNITGALIGLALGFAANGFCVLMSVLTGDIKLSFNEFNPGLFIAFLVAVCIQSGAEEVSDRCYLYQKLRRRYRHPAVAIITNAVVFACLHLLNPGITVVSVLQIVAVGILFSLFVFYFDCLWAAIMMHTGWNFTQSIVFGLPNSGIVSEYSLFKLDAASARNGIFYNVNFGVEGSIGAVAVLVLLCVVVILIGRRSGERRDYWEEMEKQELQKIEAEA